MFVSHEEIKEEEEGKKKKITPHPLRQVFFCASLGFAPIPAAAFPKSSSPPKSSLIMDRDSLVFLAKLAEQAERCVPSPLCVCVCVCV